MENTVQTEPIDVRSEDFADFMTDYPFASEVDSVDDLPLQAFVAVDNGEAFEARVIGFGSSYRKTHKNHAPGTRPPGSCSGCRWTDVAIMWIPASKYYVSVTLGQSALAGERQYNTTIWTEDPTEVLKAMFAPTKAEFQRDTGPVAIPPHSALAFREAASVDSRLGDLLDRYGDAIPENDNRGPEVDPLAGL